LRGEFEQLSGIIPIANDRMCGESSGGAVGFAFKHYDVATQL